MSGFETGLSLLIALCAGVGLLLNSRVLEGKEKRRHGLFCYYTNLSNLLVLLYHILLPVPAMTGFLRRPGVQMAVTLTIVVTFLIYFFVLTHCGKYGRPEPGDPWMRPAANTLVHYIVPLLTLAEWILTADKGLSFRHSVFWLILPFSYFVYICLRAPFGKPIENSGSVWPYAFMDMKALGKVRWTRNILLTIVAFWLLGLLFVGLAHLF